MKSRWADRWRTAFVRVLGFCPDCRKRVRCGWPHLTFFLDAVGPDDWFNDDTAVACGRCVAVYGTALGSIVHICQPIEEKIQAAVEEAGSLDALIEEALRP